QLVEAAQKYAEYLARNKIFDHIPDAQKKLTGMTWGENLGLNYESEKNAIKRWIESPGHKANILNKDYIYFGARFAKDIWLSFELSEAVSESLFLEELALLDMIKIHY
ncbi:4565_t:CDS:2, partial [Cetraspora pellucida]